MRKPALAHVARAVFVTAGRPVLLRALAVGIAVGIACSILFSPSGLQASVVVRLVHESAPARALLWAGWLVLAAPATGAAFDAPGTTTLRSLRLPRAPAVGALLVLVSMAHLPWAVLFVRGAGFLDAFGASMLAVSIDASVLTAMRKQRRAWTACVVASVAIVFVVADPPPLILAAIGSALAPVAVHAAWVAALERRPIAWRLTRPTHPAVALWVMYWLALQRTARARLAVATMSAGTGLAALLLSLRNDPTEQPIHRGLAVMALPLTIAAAVCVAPVAECEARVRQLLRSLRVHPWAVTLAFLLAIATPTSALAASAGVAIAALDEALSRSLVAVLPVWSMVLAIGVGLWGRYQPRTRHPSPGAFVVGVVALAALATVLAVLVG